MFECSIEENGVVIDADEVIELLEDDTVSYSANFGIGGQFKQGLYIKVKVLAEDYAKGVNWIFRFLWNLEFDAEKIQILINKKLGDIVSDKRDGNTVCKATSSLRLFNSSHNSHANNLLVQASFLESLESRLETDPNSVLGDLYRLRDLLGRTNCCQFLLILDPARVADLADPWIQKQWPETNSVAEPLPLCSEYLLPRPAHGEVVQIGGVESGYLMFTSQALPTISRLEDEMCLRLYLEYLTMLEGPLWVQIRGSGLAYSYGMNYNVSDRTLRESLYRATDLPAAYSALERALIPSGSLPSLSSARSSLIFSLISSCSTPVLAAEECFRCASLLGFPEDHYRVTAVSLVLSLDASSVWRMSSIVLDALNRSDRVAVSGAISTELAHLCNISPEIE
jgi:Zn-dependent M16 (insulinase) family peptidase